MTPPPGEADDLAAALAEANTSPSPAPKGGEAEADAMAAEWEAMLGGADEGMEDPMGGGGVGRESTRVLNQDEIDSLLGFDEAGDTGSDRAGIQAILNSALVSYERLPMLEVVFDRLVRMMTTSLRNFTSDNVEVSLDDILSHPFGDYLYSVPHAVMHTVIEAEEWDNIDIMTVDSSMIYSIVDVLLGGRRGTAAMRVEG